MVGQIRLFEKIASGLLVEVDPAEADAKRVGRRWSAMHLPIEVLWTPEEEAARDAKEAQAVTDAKAQQEAEILAAADKANMRVAVLKRLGITEEEAKAILG